MSVVVPPDATVVGVAVNELIVHVVGGGVAVTVTVTVPVAAPVVHACPLVGLLPANVLQPACGVPAYRVKVVV